MNKIMLPLALGGLVLCAVSSRAADGGLIATFSHITPFLDETINLRANHQYDQTICVEAKIPLLDKLVPKHYTLIRHGAWRLLSAPTSAGLSAALPPKSSVELKSALTPLPMGETSVQCINTDRQLVVSDLTFPKPSISDHTKPTLSSKSVTDLRYNVK